MGMRAWMPAPRDFGFSACFPRFPFWCLAPHRPTAVAIETSIGHAPIHAHVLARVHTHRLEEEEVVNTLADAAHHHLAVVDRLVTEDARLPHRDDADPQATDDAHPRHTIKVVVIAQQVDHEEEIVALQVSLGTWRWHICNIANSPFLKNLMRDVYADYDRDRPRSRRRSISRSPSLRRRSRSRSPRRYLQRERGLKCVLFTKCIILIDHTDLITRKRMRSSLRLRWR